MHNIKRIFEEFNNKNYEEVIKLSENEKDVQTIVLRTFSFAFLNDYKMAIQCLKDNEELLSKNLGKLIEMHMEICFQFNKFSDALDALNHYEEYPYVSQEVEEKFIYYKDKIKKELDRLSNKKDDDESLKELLASNNTNKVIEGITRIKTLEEANYHKKALNEILSGNLNFKVKALAIIMLIDLKFDDLIKVKKNDDIITIKPCTILPFFETRKFKALINKANETQDITYAKTFETILAAYYMANLPYEVEDDENDLFQACDLLVRKYLMMPTNKMMPSPIVIKLMADIEKANELFSI